MDARASREPKELPFILRKYPVHCRRVAIPVYGLFSVTGCLWPCFAPICADNSWLLSALVLYVTAALLGIFAYAPVMRRQIQLLDSEGFNSPAYLAAENGVDDWESL